MRNYRLAVAIVILSLSTSCILDGIRPAECKLGGECDDGVFCNGEELCIYGRCFASKEPCPSGQHCIEHTRMCFATCTSHTDCDDGVFCNGQERCVEETCVPGPPPCPDFGGCVLCSEEFYECADVCIADSDCDDGLFCNGLEFCDGCFCQSGMLPCGDVAMGCDEELDECR